MHCFPRLTFIFPRLTFIAILFCVFFLSPVIAQEQSPYPRKVPVIVLTDIGGDTDDEQSLVRFLLYSNMFEVKGLYATSRMGHGLDTKPELIRRQIETYGKVYPNLQLHANGFPVPEELNAAVKIGRGDHTKFGAGLESEASEHLIEVIDESQEIVHIAIWGGQRELAQALWKVKNSRNQEKIKEFSKKIQVYAIGNQDGHRDWIVNNFKDIRYIASGFITFGDSPFREVAAYRGMYMTGDTGHQNRQWVESQIHNHGPLCDLYPRDGHGTNGMKEGDTPSFLGLISNGLNVPEFPEWGSWGGRYRRFSVLPNVFIDAQDILNGQLNERHTVARWRRAFQNDFAARADWCVFPCEKANHPPQIVLNHSSDQKPLYLKVKPGERLVLDASESGDPDGHELDFRWYFYEELSFPENADLEFSTGGRTCQLTASEEMKGRTHHLILEATDRGEPPLTSYKRIVIHVDAN